MYLAQAVKPGSIERARAIATAFGFSFEYRYTGYGELGARLRTLTASEDAPAWPA